MDKIKQSLFDADPRLWELQKLSKRYNLVHINRFIFEALIEIARALNLQTESSLQIEEERKAMYPKVSFADLPKPDFTKLILEAVEKRDRLEEQIGKLVESVEGMPENMRDFLLTTSKAPLEEQLRGMDEYISSLQEQLEKKGG